jgi:hypothetical protein
VTRAEAQQIAIYQREVLPVERAELSIGHHSEAPGSAIGLHTPYNDQSSRFLAADGTK